MYRKYVPNALTLSRFPLAVLFLVLHVNGYYKLAVTSAILCCITDWADGKLARKWNVESEFGKNVDPYADKWICWILTIAILSSLGMSPWVIAFIPIAITQMVYDGGLALIRWVWGRKNIPTNSFAKWKTTALMFGLIILYLDIVSDNGFGYTGIIGYVIGIALTWIAIYYALRAGVTYIRAYGWGKLIPFPLHLL